MVRRTQLAQIIDQKLTAKTSSKRLSKEVAAYLLTSGRVSDLAPIMRDVLERRAEHGLVEATVSSARPLGTKPIQEISQLVKTIQPQTKKIVLDQELNPSLIGGLKLKVVNRQLDLSVRAKLNQFKQLTSQRGA